MFPIYILENEKIKAKITNYGLRLIELNNKKTGENVIVSYRDIENYIGDNYLIGALLIGPAAGRTSPNIIRVEKQLIVLEQENGVHLHGGTKNFANQIFTVLEVTAESLKLKLDQEIAENNSGELNVFVNILLKGNELVISASYSCNKKVYLNPASHIYFKNNTVNDQAFCKLPIKYFYKVDKEYLIQNEKTPYNSNELSLKMGENNLFCQGEVIINNCFVLEIGKIKFNWGENHMSLISDLKSVVIYSADYLSEISNLLNHTSAICYEFQYPNSYIHDSINRDCVILLPGQKKDYTYKVRLD